MEFCLHPEDWKSFQRSVFKVYGNLHKTILKCNIELSRKSSIQRKTPPFTYLEEITTLLKKEDIWEWDRIFKGLGIPTATAALIRIWRCLPQRQLCGKLL